MPTAQLLTEKSHRPASPLEELLHRLAPGSTLNICQSHSTIEVGHGRTKNAISIMSNGTRASFFIHNHQLIKDASLRGIKLEEVELHGHLYNEDKYSTTDITALLQPENENTVAALVAESIAVLTKRLS